MTDNRRMTTDRFYGGVSKRLANLHLMLENIRDFSSSRSELNDWVIANTEARGENAVNRHLAFLESIELIELSGTECKLDRYGKQWLNDKSPKTLYDALSSGVKGFDTILYALEEGPKTDEQIMRLLVSEFDEAEMTTPGPAVRHREWLQVLGFIEREGKTNHLTTEGKNLIKSGRADTNKGHQPNESPDVGELFSAKVDRISSSGNGIIELEEGHINIGPVISDSVGKEITAKMVTSVYAVCKNPDFKKKTYSDKHPYFNTPSDMKSSGVITPTTGNQENKIRTENSIEFCDDCGSMLKIEGDIWLCYSCGYEKQRYSQNKTESSGPSETSNDSNNKNIDKSNSDFSQSPGFKPTDSNSSETETNSYLSISNKTKRKKNNQPSENQEERNIDELRKEAEDDAVDEVEQTTSTTTSTKSQYSRSTKVKEYVKARADGNCEGCGEPAPFTSKTGEPYLHAHHVHELSDGGSDTPDTVIALCPNCHYRVHHGEDGDEYNQELLEIVQEKESKQS